MSRSNYSDDIEQWDLIRWRGAVNSAIRGRRGQGFLRELAAALDAMPEKKLIILELQNQDGEVCALGAVGVARGIDMKGIDAEEPHEVADAFDIAVALACEIAYINDESWRPLTPKQRWHRVRVWVAENIRKPAPASPPETPKKVPMEFCNSCGAPLDSGSGPCPKCGTEEPR